MIGKWRVTLISATPRGLLVKYYFLLNKSSRVCGCKGISRSAGSPTHVDETAQESIADRQTYSIL